MHITKFSFLPPIIAHRGLSSLAPENTLLAFSMAKEAGLRWVEFDVQLTACNEVVVFHDFDLTRTTQAMGNLNDHSYDSLKLLDVGSWFDARYDDQRIPTLRQVLIYLAENQMAANIEIKSLPGQEKSLIDKVWAIIQELHCPTYYISSFSRLCLELLREKSSTIPLGYLMDEWQEDWQDHCERLTVSAVITEHNAVSAARIKEVKKAGFALLTYTVNSAQRAEDLLGLGVDAIFSDCPTEILALLSAEGALLGGNPVRAR